MNEILQKRIEEAKQKEYPLPPIVDGAVCKVLAMAEQTAYKKGAIFALQNQWISVEKALPPIREKDIGNRSWSDWVLIMTHGGGAFMDCYAFHRKEWLNNGNDVTHWMPIPSLEGGEEC